MPGREGTAKSGATALTVPAYLHAVRSIHGLGVSDMARALRVSTSVVRRWSRGQLVPPWGRLRRMTELWGGSAELLALGAALQRYSRETGVSLDEAARMIRSGRRNAPERRRRSPVRDRRQLTFPIVR
jgi:ribosome-binding protein aMBF1 (putative translation factor)